ncbi:adenylyltransferase/cytidyltransferase family protein [Cytobacillus praedii]|uniref:adenylyltransferase/cytidyltransferase family protein n=1 Tax=Cytobacillus praedii TaxID=1742358 RepID=UPI003F7F93D6
MCQVNRGQHKKIFKLEEINQEIFTKRESKKVVLAGGCFDIFHIGHLEYLQGAKDLGDILIVGVNSDDSYLWCKSRKPRFSEEQRISIIAALEMVDYVFVFNHRTLKEAIEIISPHVFTKGIDYKNKKIIEEDVCQQKNIGIEYIGECKKASSSNLYDILFSTKGGY